MAFKIVPGATIEILGGGQLGRMLALAAAKLGLKTHVYAQDPESPAFDVASSRTLAPYEDELALAEFAGTVELVTFEFEAVLLLAVVQDHPYRPSVLEARRRLVRGQ